MSLDRRLLICCIFVTSHYCGLDTHLTTCNYVHVTYMDVTFVYTLCLGSFVTAETKTFAYFYIGQKAVLLFKSG